MSAESHIRRIASDDTIPASVLRDFLMHTLRHEAISDVLIEQMACRVEHGQLDHNSLTAVLPDLIGEVTDAASREDWLAVADALIEDSRESLLEVCES